MSANATMLTGAPADAGPVRELAKGRDRPRLGVSGFLKRLERAIYRRLQADRASDVGAFIAANGGVLTDDLERRIGRHFGSQGGR